MGTKVDILDFAIVKDVQMQAEINSHMTISLELICQSEEDFSLVYQTILEKINGMRE